MGSKRGSMDWLSLKDTLEKHDFYYLIGSDVYEQYIKTNKLKLGEIKDMDTFKIVLGWWVATNILSIQ